MREEQKIMLCIWLSQENQTKDFPGDPVAKALGFQCKGPGFDLWFGN